MQHISQPGRQEKTHSELGSVKGRGTSEDVVRIDQGEVGLGYITDHNAVVEPERS